MTEFDLTATDATELARGVRGMAARALGSDGGGSIRYPAGLTGLVGLKPQRNRIPVGSEHGSAWHGLLALGPITRSVRDAARFLDVAADAGSEFRDANAEPSRALRIAMSINAPAGSQVRLSAARRRATEDAAELLAALGHEIVETDIDYGIGSLWNSSVRLLTGVRDDVAAMPDRAELEPRTRAVARLGRLVPDRLLERALGNQQRIASRINRVFEEADVVLTPLCATAAPTLEGCPTRGAIRTLRAANTSAWLVPWNLTGQPALAVPTGIDDDGLPTAIQLVGRPDGEATLLALAAQIESARPFPRWTPAPTN